VAIDAAALRRFLLSREDYRAAEGVTEDGPSRSSQAYLSGNSKVSQSRSCTGFPLNSYEPIECMLHGERFMVDPQEGVFLYVADWQSFVVSDDVTIVGVENMENFRLIRRQRELFEHHIGGRLLFVSRYPQSSDLRQWLCGVSNRYIHFGDFDLAGINIFLTEFHRYLGERSSFFIPDDVEKRIAMGSTERYNVQLPRYHGVCSSNPQLSALIEMINLYHRCYDQEGYIVSDSDGRSHS
jgi:hypothetical protein